MLRQTVRVEGVQGRCGKLVLLIRKHITRRKREYEDDEPRSLRIFGKRKFRYGSEGGSVHVVRTSRGRPRHAGVAEGGPQLLVRDSEGTGVGGSRTRSIFYKRHCEIFTSFVS